MHTTRLNYVTHCQTLESGFPPREVVNQLRLQNIRLCLFELIVHKPVEAILSN